MPTHSDIKDRDVLDLPDKVDDTERVEHADHHGGMHDAISSSTLSPWSKSSLHLFVSVLVALGCSFANGFDSSLLSGLLPMRYFQQTFGMGTTGTLVGTISCLYTIGHMVGAPIGAFISDRYGRRWCMFAGSVMCIIGVVIAAAGNHLATFATGRFILGIGTTVAMVAGPAYTMEISPPQWRGRFTGLYNCGWFAGNIPASAATYGCNYINSHMQWRIPILLQAVASVFVIAGVFFIPESPRFLMANGREDEALAFLVKYHGNGDPQSRLVQLEYAEFKQGISTTGADKRWWDYRVLVDSKNHRWRTLQVVMMSIAGQYSGNGLGYFNVVIYANLGIREVSQQLAYNLLYSGIAASGALCGALLTDKMPRRRILVIGTFGCACLLAVNAGLQSVMNRGGGYVAPPQVARGALAAYYLFAFLFMFTYTPLQAVIPTEALETTTRAKGLALNNLITGCMGFLNQFAGPIALANIGYNYVYVFVGWDTVEAGLWYFFGVEAKGRTLEELEEVYDAPNPVKASRIKARAAYTARADDY